ncbi:outer membrane beta-barrel protein [uncultured Chryseobacterium sp.]|uniref:outer membrane beta-barrel protein n=1 Tax=uncultured Chryseobacterium sp. TaxID=259322 RepID=UPI0025CF3904|nr:outer membrane beta-barrel protein [uncultured Chryseobacterium sp.]
MSFSKCYIIAWFSLLPILAYSQKYPLKYGITAGWNYSNINAVDEKGEPSGYLSNGGELYGGLILEKQISQKSYIQSGALVSYTYVITFIEIPLFYKYNFHKKFSIMGGPKLDYLPDEQYNHSIYFKRRFGVSVNLGLDYHIFKKFNIEGYYSKQLVKQFDDNILTFYDAKRDVYRIGITYFIN